MQLLYWIASLRKLLDLLDTGLLMLTMERSWEREFQTLLGDPAWNTFKPYWQISEVRLTHFGVGLLSGPLRVPSLWVTFFGSSYLWIGAQLLHNLLTASLTIIVLHLDKTVMLLEQKYLTLLLCLGLQIEKTLEAFYKTLIRDKKEHLWGRWKDRRWR